MHNFFRDTLYLIPSHAQYVAFDIQKKWTNLPESGGGGEGGCELIWQCLNVNILYYGILSLEALEPFPSLMISFS